VQAPNAQPSPQAKGPLQKKIVRKASLFAAGPKNESFHPSGPSAKLDLSIYPGKEVVQFRGYNSCDKPGEHIARVRDPGLPLVVTFCVLLGNIVADSDVAVPSAIPYKSVFSDLDAGGTGPTGQVLDHP
jgi:hypothetical protein